LILIKIRLAGKSKIGNIFKTGNYFLSGITLLKLNAIPEF
jgi:hypothetical protein